MSQCALTARTVRVPIATLDRLRDAAERYGTTHAQIMRKASCFYENHIRLGRVVSLPKRESTTRDDSTPVQALGLAEWIDAALYAQIANWYLDLKDTGYRKPTPTIDEADLNTPYIIEETV